MANKKISAALRLAKRKRKAEGGGLTDAPPDRPQAEMRSYDPTWRDRLGALLIGESKPSAAKYNFVTGLLGSAGAGKTGTSLADMTGPGAALGVQENLQGGNYGAAAADAFTGTLLPGGGAARRAISGAAGAFPRATRAGLGALFGTAASSGVGTDEAAAAGPRLTLEQRRALEMERQRADLQQRGDEDRARVTMETARQTRLDEIAAESQRREAEVRFSSEQRRAEAARRSNEAMATARQPFNQRYPALAEGLTAAAPMASFAIPYASKVGGVLARNAATKPWTAGVERGEQALLSSDPSTRAASLGELKSLRETPIPPERGASASTIGISSLLPAEAALAPSEYNAMMLPGDSPDQQKAIDLLTSPSALAGRVLPGAVQGLAASGAGAKVPVPVTRNEPPSARVQGLISGLETRRARPRKPKEGFAGGGFTGFPEEPGALDRLQDAAPPDMPKQWVERDHPMLNSIGRSISDTVKAPRRAYEGYYSGMSDEPGAPQSEGEGHEGMKDAARNISGLALTGPVPAMLGAARMSPSTAGIFVGPMGARRLTEGGQHPAVAAQAARQPPLNLTDAEKALWRQQGFAPPIESGMSDSAAHAVLDYRQRIGMKVDDDVFKASGWSAGKDMLPRKELPDLGARLVPTGQATRSGQEFIWQHPAGDVHAAYDIPPILVSPNYPVGQASFDPLSRRIVIGANPGTQAGLASANAMVASQVQRIIQRMEGFEPGANFAQRPSSLKAGDVEARNVQARKASGFRYQSNPIKTEDTPRAQQLLSPPDRTDKFDAVDRAIQDALRAAGSRRNYAPGGSVGSVPWYVKGESRNISSTGPLHSTVPGRTDHLPINVPSGSYVVPADIVSGMGQGNTNAGMKVLGQMFFNSGPFGMKPMAMGHGSGPPKAQAPKPMKFADGGATPGGDVPIMAAGGEFVIPPEKVTEIGQGDINMGHDILDEFIKSMRSEVVKTLKSLPGPQTD